MLTITEDDFGGSIGKTCICPNCGQEHEVETTGPLHTVKCEEGPFLYVVRINGRELKKNKS